MQKLKKVTGFKRLLSIDKYIVRSGNTDYSCLIDSYKDAKLDDLFTVDSNSIKIVDRDILKKPKKKVSISITNGDYKIKEVSNRNGKENWYLNVQIKSTLFKPRLISYSKVEKIIKDRHKMKNKVNNSNISSHYIERTYNITMSDYIFIIYNFYNAPKNLNDFQAITYSYNKHVTSFKKNFNSNSTKASKLNNLDKIRKFFIKELKYTSLATSKFEKNDTIWLVNRKNKILVKKNSYSTFFVDNDLWESFEKHLKNKILSNKSEKIDMKKYREKVKIVLRELIANKLKVEDVNKNSKAYWKYLICF